MTSNELVRILVVDDETAIRYAVAKTLERANYWVESAASAEEALEKLEALDYTVVLTDIRMPGISGVDLLAHIREHYPDVSVILMTGYASLQSAIESLRLGAHDYLIKPSRNRDIRESVERAVERAQGMRRRRKLLTVLQNGLQELSAEQPESPPLRLPETQTNGGHEPLSPPMQSLSAMELGPLTLYPGRYQIVIEGKGIDLTPTEFDLLLYLVAHRGRIVPCSELVREVRGYAVDEPEAREVIRPHVSNLRRKIKLSPENVDLIVNVRGIGYRLADFD